MDAPETAQTRTVPRRRAGNVRIEDRHYLDYKRRVRTSRWKTDASGKLVPVGRRWIVHWVDQTGKPRSQSFEKREQADAFRTRTAAELHEGTYVDRRQRETRFEDVAALYVTSLATKAKATRVSHESVLRNHVLPTFGSVPLATITKTDVVVWVSGLLDKGLSPATVHRCFVALRGVLTLAVPDYIRVDPSTGVKLPKLGPAKDRFLTHAEVARLADAADHLHALRSSRRKGRDRPTELGLDADGLRVIPSAPSSIDGLVIRFLAYTGVRIGECAALRVSDIEPAKGAVFVSRSLSEAEGPISAGPTKSGKSRRAPIPKAMRTELAEHLAGRRPSDWAFPAAEGGPLRRVNWANRVLRPATELAGLSPLSPHDLRHTFASLSASSGVRVEIVSSWMGHTDPGFTLRRYVGLFEADMSASADLLGDPNASE